MIKERILQIKCAALHDGFRATPVLSSLDIYYIERRAGCVNGFLHYKH